MAVTCMKKLDTFEARPEFHFSTEIVCVYSGAKCEEDLVKCFKEVCVVFFVQ